MRLSLTSPTPPTWGIHREMVGNLFELWCPIRREWWGIVVSRGQTAFFRFLWRGGKTPAKKNGKKRSGHARLGHCSCTPSFRVALIYYNLKHHPSDFKTSYDKGQRRAATRTCILHAFKNISHEHIDYSTKSALTGLIKCSDSTPHKL